jgi:hypothetical protein
VVSPLGNIPGSSKSPPTRRTSHPALGAGANGIGGGTAFVVLAEIFSPAAVWHQIFVFLTPFMTLGCSGLYLYAYQRLMKWQFMKSLQEAMKTVEREIANPNTTPGQKDRLVKERESLVEAEINFHRRTLLLISH